MLHPLRLQGLHASPNGTLHHPQLQSLAPDAQSLAVSPDPNEGIFQRYIGPASQAQHHSLHAPNPFAHNADLQHAPAEFQGVAPAGYPHSAGRFNLIQAPPPSHPPIHQAAPQILQRTHDLEPQAEYVQAHEAEDVPVTSHGQFEGLKLIPNPPDLDEWRHKLFHVDDTITLTEEEHVFVMAMPIGG